MLFFFKLFKLELLSFIYLRNCYFSITKKSAAEILPVAPRPVTVATN
jgi:hypothetical protein